jgi:hypothetical protein
MSIRDGTRKEMYEDGKAASELLQEFASERRRAKLCSIKIDIRSGEPQK